MKVSILTRIESDFKYLGSYIDRIISTIQKEIYNNGKPLTKKEIKEIIGDEEDGCHGTGFLPTHYHEYPNDIIDEFKKAVHILRMAEIYAQQIDELFYHRQYTTEPCFVKRLKEDLEKLKQQDNE